MKRLLLKLLHRLGYVLQPRDGRNSLAGALRQARAAGLAPEVVVDVGAAHGGFARQCAGIFPAARYVLVEPLSEFHAGLAEVAAHIPACRVEPVAASGTAGEVTFNVHPDLYGSSLFLENEDSDVNGVPRTVRTATLDQLVTEPGQVLLKIDVQGAEMAVLGGATGLLERCAYIIVEVSFLKFFKGGVLAHEVIAWMAARGFALYDVLGLAHRPLDGALAQADLVFVPENGPLRRVHHYATAAQREALTRRLRGGA